MSSRGWREWRGSPLSQEELLTQLAMVPLLAVGLGLLVLESRRYPAAVPYLGGALLIGLVTLLTVLRLGFRPNFLPYYLAGLAAASLAVVGLRPLTPAVVVAYLPVALTGALLYGPRWGVSTAAGASAAYGLTVSLSEGVPAAEEAVLVVAILLLSSLAVGGVTSQRRRAEAQARQSERRLERSVQRANVLLEVAQAVTSTLERTEVLRQVALHVGRACGVDRCSLLLLDESGRKLAPIMSQFTSGQKADELWSQFRQAQPQPVDDAPLIQQVIRERRTALLEDPTQEHLLPRRWTEPFGIQKLLLVPLVSRERVIGMMALDYTSRERSFSPEQIDLAEALGRQTAFAIENALLHRREEEARQALEALTLELEERVEERTRELRQAQQRLLEAERDATLGRVAATMAHEMRQPLGVLHNLAYLLRERLPGHSSRDERLSRLSTTLNREVDRLDRHLTALLEFTQPIEASRQVIDLAALVEATLSRLDLDPAIETQVELDRLEAVADPEQVQSALGKIVANAAESMPHGGRLTLSGLSGDGWVGFEVADTGQGIPDEEVARVFEPLYTTKQVGLGLGLPTARLLVQAQGGELSLESRPGEGTRVAVRLPAAKR